MMNFKIVAFAFFAILVGCVVAQGDVSTNPTQAPMAATRDLTLPTLFPTSTSAPTSSSAPAPSTNSASTTPSTVAPSDDLCAVTPTSAEPLQILVPLYMYPGSAWDALIDAARADVKIIAVINPSSGPVASGPDSAFNTYMPKLTQAGIDMLGYVHTSYGTRSVNDVNGEIDVYSSMYPGLKGIFLDEASNAASDIPFYTNVYNHIQSKPGYNNTILNPGAQPDQGYLAISTNIVIFEDAGANIANNNYASFVKCAPSAAEKSGYKYKFSGIAHSTDSGSMSSVLSSMQNSGMGLVYVTDGAGGCCTYNTLTSYLASEASSVAAM